MIFNNGKQILYKNYLPSSLIIVDLLQIDLKAKFVVGAAIPEIKKLILFSYLPPIILFKFTFIKLSIDNSFKIKLQGLYERFEKMRIGLKM
jgi:hypothetical protein